MKEINKCMILLARLSPQASGITQAVRPEIEMLLKIAETGNIVSLKIVL